MLKVSPFSNQFLQKDSDLILHRTENKRIIFSKCFLVLFLFQTIKQEIALCFVKDL